MSSKVFSSFTVKCKNFSEEGNSGNNTIIQPGTFFDTVSSYCIEGLEQTVILREWDNAFLEKSLEIVQY